MKRLAGKWLPIACVVAMLAKVALCAFMPIDVHANAAYDDAWAVRAADFLASGQWLGPYDDITLIKNPGFPFWLALCTKTGIGYLVPTALLYALATAVFMLAVRPLVKNDGVFFALFALILFCPVSFATDTYQRVYRNSITAAQALLVFGAYLGMYVRIKETVPGEPLRPHALIAWALVAAVSLPWFWLSREDSIWVAPFVLVATIVMVVVLVRRLRRAERFKYLMCALCTVLIVVPLGTTAVCVQGVKAVNESHYGVAVTAEINSGNFARMIKALYAIDPDKIDGLPQNPRVAVTHATLRRAMDESETLAGIRQNVEAGFAWGDTIDNFPGDGEVHGGEFFWTLRRAVRDAGYYAKGARTVDAFYGQVADELEDALANGRLAQRATMPSSIMTPWRAEYAGELLPALAGIASQAIGYGDVTAQPQEASGTADGIAYFERITSNRSYRAGDGIVPACIVAEGVIWLYRVFGVLLAIAGVAALVVLVVTHAARPATRYATGPALLAAIAVLLGVFVLMAGLTYSRVSSFIPINYYYYASAAYPLLIAFNGLTVSGIISAWEAGR